MSGLSIDASLLWTAKEIFRYPDPDIVVGLKDDMLNLLDWAIFSGFDSARQLKELIEQQAVDWNEIEVDFTSLFLNGYPITGAHPFAGWYLGDGIVFGNSDKKARQFYSRYGVNYDQNQELPADHIMVEMEFVAMMAEEYLRTGKASCVYGLREMITGYMDDWVFEFLHDVETHARSGFYKVMAGVVALLLRKLKCELREVA